MQREQRVNTELMMDNKKYANAPAGGREWVLHHQKFKETYFDNLITSSWDITLSFTD